MKKVSFIIFLLFVFSCSSTKNTAVDKTRVKQPKDPVAYANTITEEEIKEMLYVYASDEFEGRNTGTAGEKKAIEYLKNYYINNKISPAQTGGAYYQSVPLQKPSILPEGYITISGKNYTLGEYFVTFSAPRNGTFTHNEVVFAGYGIEDDNYSDYKNLDIAGKLVLVKGGEPKNEDGTYVISGTSKASNWSNLGDALNAKIGLAKEKNAAGILFYEKTNFSLVIQQFNYLKSRPKNNNLILRNEEEGDFFYAIINSDIASALDENIDDHAVVKTISKTISIRFKGESKAVDANNVVAYIKGSEKPDEYVVISAHLDHIGVDENGNVYNGADDDGSGTIAILEIAEAFKKAASEGNGPERSVVFLHVTGKEKGFLGSSYYTENPIFPLENTIANLNIDMIGRIDPEREGDRNYVYLIGSDRLSNELHTVSEEVNAKYMNMELDYKYNENDPNKFYYRSDHYNFARKNIPIIFYFSGTHPDYHKVTDTPDKINYDLLTNRAKLIFHTAWELANRESRIVVDKIAK